MKRLLAAFVGFVLLAGPAYGGGSQPSGNTGDRKFDSTLERINVAAQADPDGFIRQLSSRYITPEQEIRQTRETYGLGGADLYMATAIARATGRPVLSVAEEHGKNQGKGWGVIAQEMGIKPGSSAFHALKKGAQGSLDHMQSAAKERQKHERELKKEQERQKKKESQGKGKGQGQGQDKPR